MKRAIISVKDISSEEIVKESKKKAIDNNMSFSEAVLLLLSKWISGEVELRKGPEDKNMLLFK